MTLASWALAVQTSSFRPWLRMQYSFHIKICAAPPTPCNKIVQNLRVAAASVSGEALEPEQLAMLRCLIPPIAMPVINEGASFWVGRYAGGMTDSCNGNGVCPWIGSIYTWGWKMGDALLEPLVCTGMERPRRVPDIWLGGRVQVMVNRARR